MYPQDFRYTKTHEWIHQDGEVYVMGITAHAAEQLGDITYVELPQIGVDVNQGDSAAAVESVKAASDVYAPAGGRVCAVNESLDAAPELVNRSPHEDGWFFKLENVKREQLESLLSADEYKQYVEGLNE